MISAAAKGEEQFAGRAEGKFTSYSLTSHVQHLPITALRLVLQKKNSLAKSV